MLLGPGQRRQLVLGPNHELGAVTARHDFLGDTRLYIDETPKNEPLVQFAGALALQMESLLSEELLHLNTGFGGEQV